MRSPLETSIAFFRSHAGYSVAAGESRRQGKDRSARALAHAEQRAIDLGVTFEWVSDSDLPFEVISDDPRSEGNEPYESYGCIGRTSDGRVYTSLWGIQFPEGSSPYQQPYRRVVEAELALEIPDDETGEDGDPTSALAEVRK